MSASILTPKVAGLLVDSDWEVLLGKLDRFNAFRILRIADHEIRHSNVLAWLFDPEGNHGLGETFLRKFLLSVGLDTPDASERTPCPSALELLELPLGSVSVYREQDNIDLLVQIDSSPGKGTILLIENKIFSGEHSNQLANYLQKTMERYPDYRVLPVFLTLNAQDASCAAYWPVSHELVHQLIKSLMETRGERIPANVKSFLQQYLEILQEKVDVNQDQEVEALARRIFSKHEDAIRLIYDIGNRRSIAEAWGYFLTEINGKALGIESLWGVQHGWIWFQLPAQRLQTVDPAGGWGNGKASSWWVRIEGQDQIRMVLEVGPWKIPEQRYAFLEHLKSNGFNIWNKEGGNFTRLSSHKVGGIADWTQSEEIAKKLVQLWKKMQPDFEKYCKATESYPWPA